MFWRMAHPLVLLLLPALAALGAAPAAAPPTDKAREAARIETECGLKTGTITVLGDHVTLRPSPDEAYEKVDCALARLNKGVLGKLGFVGNEAAPNTAAPARAPSAQIVQPPSPAKLRLIRRYLKVIGLQQQLDSGSFLERYALPGGPMWPASTPEVMTESVLGGFEARIAALERAYHKHHAEYQQAYERHVNWEFTERELAEIVGFLEKPVGKHFLEGRWRMEAYVGTDTEELEERIVKEAIASIAK
jgi:hypothetical protein